MSVAVISIVDLFEERSPHAQRPELKPWPKTQGPTHLSTTGFCSSSTTFHFPSVVTGWLDFACAAVPGCRSQDPGRFFGVACAGAGGTGRC